MDKEGGGLILFAASYQSGYLDTDSTDDTSFPV
jgi:hypothetical protein